MSAPTAAYDAYSATQNGINYTESFDGRRTWTTPADYWIPSPSALMYLGKFPSGNFFLIHHYQFEKRDHMSVLLSHDEGRSYDHVLLLDERFPVAYPVVFLDGDKVYAVYDRARYGYKESIWLSSARRMCWPAVV